MVSSLKELIQKDIVKIAKLPKMNSFSPEEVDGYTVTLIDHDYPGKTPSLWNTVYDSLTQSNPLHPKFRSVMVVADPTNIEVIFNALLSDEKYFGGGTGSGFKDIAAKYLRKVNHGALDQSSEVSGSVNIIAKKNGKLVGFDTDAEGYAKGLEKEFGIESINDKNIVVLGAGGVTSPIIYSLLKRSPRKLVILNRTIGKAERIVNNMKKLYPHLSDNLSFGGEDRIGTELKDAELVINTSNKGTAGEKLAKFSAFAKTTEENLPNEDHMFNQGSEAEENIKGLSKKAIVSDINLVEDETTTIKIAKAYGISRTQDGKPMMFFQAIPAFLHVHPNIISEGELENMMRKASF
ncbi:MAG: hypothetical protein QGF74_01795 [Candidatus Nanoarchaeia archaeon]|jgi:shikimate 5-dehydrogenase|nr:hypothetical protein [Candidatus Nanoarchaeia archaeon]|tara:strand:+ start:2129 stop:3178 length:1050 start_codon:yes stop_codon:yes gene_type:complete